MAEQSKRPEDTIQAREAGLTADDFRDPIPKDAPVLDRAAVFATRKVEVVPVHVPEWGGVVHVRAITAAQRAALERYASSQKGAVVKVDPGKLRSRLVLLATCNADGSPFFDGADEQRLTDQPASALERVFDVALALAGMGPDNDEQTEKN